MTFLENETKEVDDFSNLLWLNFHGLTKFLSSLISMPFDAFEYHLALVGRTVFSE